MVDYSKWDRMEFSDSSDSEEGSVNGDPSRPRVTSLQEPGRVTISADGSVQIGQAESSGSTDTTKQQLSSSALPVVSGSNSGDAVDISSLPDINARDDDEHAVNTKEKQQQQQQQQQQEQNRQEQVFNRNGGKHFTKACTKKAQIRLPVYWSQDRYAVTLRIGFSTKQFPSRTIRVHVSGALKYEDRHSAVGSGSMMTDYISKQNNDSTDNGNGGNGPSFGSVKVVSISSDDQEETVLFNGLLPRPIHLNKDEEEVEYEIETSASDTIITDDDNDDDKEETCCDRFVAIVLPKAVPMHGMVLWWDCPIVGFPKISVASIQDRQTLAAKSSSSNDEKKEAFQKAWAEAHDMFREKMKKKEKHIM